MTHNKMTKYLTAAFAVTLVLFGNVAEAKMISNDQVEEQKRAVMVEIVKVLQEDVKLLQMVLIQNLEYRVNYLQTLVANK